MRFLEWFIALRYLFSRERRALVSANTLISIAGVAVGVATLTVTAGVMDGAIELLFGKITDLYPHVSIARLDEKGEPAPTDEGLAERLRADPRVTFAEPVLSRPAIIQPFARGGGSNIEAQKEAVQLMALPRLGRGTLYELGAGRPGPFELKAGEALIGRPLAQRLGLTSGSQALLLRFDPTAPPNRLGLRSFRVVIGEPYQTGYYEFDSATAFVSMEQERRMYQIDQGCDYIQVKLKDPYAVDAFVSGLELPPHCQATTWIQHDAEFFAALKFQKYMLVVIMMLIVVVAAFNIIGTLVLMVFDKTREVGILKATGMRRGSILRIFLLDGALIGTVGTAVGVGLGLLVSWGLRLYKFPMPEGVYNFSALPVVNEPRSIALIVACALAICVLASLLPAVKASRLDPVEALRYE